MTDDIWIVEAPDDVDDGVRAADIRQELVPKPLSFARAFDKSRDIHKLDHRRSVFLRLIHLCKVVKPFVRHGHDAHIRVDGAERVVCRLRACVRQRVEKRAFADIRQSHDA